MNRDQIQPPYKIDFTKGFETGVYTSVSYNMFCRGDILQQKELDKTYYIDDLQKRVCRMREILGRVSHNETKVYVNGGFYNDETEDLKALYAFGTTAEIEELRTDNKSLFFGVWTEIGMLRVLEIELYLKNIYEGCIGIQSGDFDKICYLIDKRYSYHKNVLSDELSDLLHRTEYNHLIYDYIGNMIKTISNIEIERIERPTRKPLKWQANKSVIGTLFGLLSQYGIIEGTKEDINSFLRSGFEGLSESTLRDNIALKPSDNKYKYHVQTVETLTEWVKMLKRK